MLTCFKPSLVPSKRQWLMNGDCDVFAYVLAKKQNLKIYALVEDRFVNGKTVEALVHAFCVPKIALGEMNSPFEEVIDARGHRSLEEIIEEYGIKNPRIVHCTRNSILDYNDYNGKNKHLLNDKVKQAEDYLDSRANNF